VAIAGEVVIITGAAGGIGRHLARRFAEAGARVAAVDLRPLDTTLAEVREIEGEIFGVTADVTNEEQVREMAAKVNAHFGQIDTLINNAGIATHFNWMPRWPAIRDMDASFFNQVMGVNLGGTFLCTKHVIPYMESRRTGHIIGVSGGGGGTRSAVYLASKRAIRERMHNVAAEEREHNICVVSTTPGGAIATEEAPPDVREKMPGVEIAGDRYLAAASAGMEFSGHYVDLVDGRLTIVE